MWIILKHQVLPIFQFSRYYWPQDPNPPEPYEFRNDSSCSHPQNCQNWQGHWPLHSVWSRCNAGRCESGGRCLLPAGCQDHVTFTVCQIHRGECWFSFTPLVRYPSWLSSPKLDLSRAWSHWNPFSQALSTALQLVLLGAALRNMRNAASSSLVPTVGWQGRAGPVVLSGLPEDFLSKNKIQNLILKTDLSVTRVAFLTRIYVYKTPELSLIVGK